jgi:hypothetical protein
MGLMSSNNVLGAFGEIFFNDPKFLLASKVHSNPCALRKGLA